MKKTPLLFAMALVSVPLMAQVLLASGGPGITPDQALKQLQEGNTRYVAGELQHPHLGAARRRETATKGQHPFVTVIGCSDSREVPELIFDQGIGDVFVIRVAGNVCDTDEVGSIEYGIDHLETPLFVVLGHTHCGAVTAVVTHAELHGSIPLLVDNIAPALAKAEKANPDVRGKALIPATIEANVWQSIEDLLKRSPAARQRAKAGKLKIVGAIYDIETGAVKWLGTHPDEGRLLRSTGKPDHGHH